MTSNIFPEKLNNADVKSAAEFTLYQAFRDQLSDDFNVFHSVAWLGIRSSGERPSDGETDFIIAHPRMGILLIEVKGGLVSFSPADGWSSIRKDHSHVEIKNPFEQVRSNKYALLNKLRSLPNWQGPIPTLGHAVAFPDGAIDLPELSPESPRAIILLHEDLADVNAWVRGCLKFWAGDKFIPPGDHGVSALRELLARSWLLRKPRLGEEFGVETRAMNQFTHEQFQMLEILSSRPKAAIRGVAGSGKTMLAMQKAIKLADEGFRVLLTCYNRNLMEELERTSKRRPRLKIRSFHGLCQEYAVRLGLDQTEEWDSSRKDFFEIVMPGALLEAASTEEDSFKFDAIIVDEGQDFLPSWWAALELLFANPNNGIYYIFYDDNQLLYTHKLMLPVEEIPFALTVNCRNTQPIFKALVDYYKSDLQLRCKGPAGRQIQVNTFAGDQISLRTVLTEVLSRLVYVEKISAEDVVLLSAGGLEKPPLLGLMQPGTFRLVAGRSKNDTDIYSPTIRQFKGLESPVVILLVPSGLNRYDELMYVGVSRARNHLEIVVDAETGQDLLGGKIVNAKHPTFDQ